MRIVAYFVIMVLLLVFQSSVISFIPFSGKPDLPLVFALCISLYKGENLGAFMGFLNGIFEDMIYGRFLGFNALVKFLTGYVAGYASRDIFKGPALMTMVLVFLGSLLYDFFFILTNLFINELNHPLYHLAPVVLPSAFFNMVLSPLVYTMVVKMERFFDYYFNIKY